MRTMKRIGWKSIGVAALSAMVFVAPVGADDHAGTKLLRGVVACVFGFLEIPGNMVQIAQKDSIPEGIFEGGLKGLLMMVTRTTVGVYETVTFPIPIKDYKPVIDPTYPWDYFCGEEEKPAAPAAPAQR